MFWKMLTSSNAIYKITKLCDMVIADFHKQIMEKDISRQGRK
jgi:hypothetical protein